MQTKLNTEDLPRKQKCAAINLLSPFFAATHDLQRKSISMIICFCIVDESATDRVRWNWAGWMTKESFQAVAVAVQLRVPQKANDAKGYDEIDKDADGSSGGFS